MTENVQKIKTLKITCHNLTFLLTLPKHTKSLKQFTHKNTSNKKTTSFDFFFLISKQ